MHTDYVISAPVGRDGANNPDDVIVIQILLNRVPVADGGPDPKLDADGKIGPKTLAAIDRFQQHHKLGSDGRIDPGGKMLAKINQVVKDSVNEPTTPPPIIPSAGTPSKKAANAIIMGIWGRGGGSDDKNPDNGITYWIKRLRPQLVDLGVPEAHIWSTSWNPNEWKNEHPWGIPDTNKHLDDLIGREANPSYVALIGHSYGGRAVCVLSQEINRRLNRQPNYVALLDPVFGAMGDREKTEQPHGDLIQNWYQRNAIAIVGEEEDCSGVLSAGLPLGISLGRSIDNAENEQVMFQRKHDGTEKTRSCPDGKKVPMHITHITIDGDDFIWGKIIKKILSDIQNLAQ